MHKLTLIIGNKNYSSWSLRPWLLLKQAGIPFEEKLILLYTETMAKEIAVYSPSGKIPALLDGDVSIWDSLAIAEYLHEKFPEKNLWPKEEKARTLARCISAEMHSGFMALRENLNMNIRRKIQRPQTEACQKDIQRILTIWKDCRQRYGTGGDFLFGSFGIADAMYAPVVMRFKTYGVELDPISEIYAQAIIKLPAMQEWIKAAEVEPHTIAAFEK